MLDILRDIRSDIILHNTKLRHRNNSLGSKTHNINKVNKNILSSRVEYHTQLLRKVKVFTIIANKRSKEKSRMG